MKRQYEINKYFDVFNSNIKKLSDDLNINYQKLRRRTLKTNVAMVVQLDANLKPHKLLINTQEEIERA